MEVKKEYNTIPKIRRKKFAEKELRTTISIPISVSDLYIPTIGLPIVLQENRWTDGGNICICKSLTDNFNGEIGTEAAQFLFWEYINRILFAMCNAIQKEIFFSFQIYLSKSFLIGSKSPLLYSASASSSQVGIAFRSASADKTGGSVDALETSTFTVNLFQTHTFLNLFR